MLVPLSDWQNPTRRRLMALVAIQNRDVEGLLELHTTYMALKSAKRATVSPRTMEAYGLGIRDFMEWLWPLPSPAPQFQLHQATSDHIDAWINTLQTRGGHLVPEPERKPLKPSSVSSLLYGVRSLFKALEWAGVSKPLLNKAPSDPTPKEERRPALPIRLYNKLLKHLSSPHAQPPSLPPDLSPSLPPDLSLEGKSPESKESNPDLEHPPHPTQPLQSPQHQRDHLAARLMGESGLRISEVVGLNLEDIQLEEALLIIKGKGNKLRSVPLSKNLLNELNNWLLIRRAHAWLNETKLFINLGGRREHGKALTAQTLRTLFRGYYQTLEFPARYYGVHMLRHTAGTKMYKHSRDLYATARLLGHANVNTSAVYAKMDIEGLRELVEGMEGQAEQQGEGQVQGVE